MLVFEHFFRVPQNPCDIWTVRYQSGIWKCLRRISQEQKSLQFADTHTQTNKQTIKFKATERKERFAQKSCTGELLCKKLQVVQIS